MKHPLKVRHEKIAVREESDIEFWATSFRQPKSVVLSAWMSELLHIQKATQEDSRESPNSNELFFKLAATFSRGPFFVGLRHRNITPHGGRPKVSQNYIWLMEQGKALDSELTRVVNTMRLARDTFRSAALKSKNNPEKKFLTNFGVRVLFRGPPPQEVLDYQAEPYQWESQHTSAQELILAAWHHALTQITRVDTPYAPKEILNAVVNGPVICNSLNLLPQKTLSENEFIEKGTVISEFMNKIAAELMSFGPLPYLQTRNINEIIHPAWAEEIKKSMGALLESNFSDGPVVHP